MGYETRLHIGSVSEHSSGFRKRIRINGDFEGQQRGSVHTVFEDNGVEHFYLADGDTKIHVECALKTGEVELLPEADTFYFSQIAMLDMCKMESLRGRLSDDDIICRTPELYVGGDTMMSQDFYGEDLVVYDAKAVLQALRDMEEEDRGQYWRYAMATRCLETIVEKAWQKPLGVICFGY